MLAKEKLYLMRDLIRAVDRPGNRAHALEVALRANSEIGGLDTVVESLKAPGHVGLARVLTRVIATETAEEAIREDEWRRFGECAFIFGDDV